MFDPPGYPGVVGGGGPGGLGGPGGPGGVPMNTDISVFMVHGQCSRSVFIVHVVSVHCPRGQCPWSTWSVFMVHVVSVHGHDDMTYNII